MKTIAFDIPNIDPVIMQFSQNLSLFASSLITLFSMGIMKRSDNILVRIYKGGIKIDEKITIVSRTLVLSESS